MLTVFHAQQTMIYRLITLWETPTAVAKRMTRGSCLSNDRHCLPAKDACSESISDQISPPNTSVADPLGLIGVCIMVAAAAASSSCSGTEVVSEMQA